MERLGWHTALIVFDLKLVVSNMQPGCQGGGSPAVSRPFSCLLPADKPNQIHYENRRAWALVWESLPSGKS